MPFEFEISYNLHNEIILLLKNLFIRDLKFVGFICNYRSILHFHEQQIARSELMFWTYQDED